jgi:tetratricopeptide (TPR) repeat protein
MKQFVLVALASALLLMGCDTFRQAPAQGVAPAEQSAGVPRSTPSPAQQLIRAGDTFADQGDLAQAIAQYSAAIQLAPEDAQAYNNRGFAYWHSGDNAAALADLSRALALRPDYVNALTNRAFVYFDQNAFDQCAADATRAIELDSNDDSAYMIRGNVESRRGNWGAALGDWLQANKIRNARKQQ